MNHGRSGWHALYERRRDGVFAQLPIVPTGWDQLLRELHIGEDDAIAILKARVAPPPRARLETYVRQACRSRFVPPAALDALDLSLEVSRYCDRECQLD